MVHKAQECCILTVHKTLQSKITVRGSVLEVHLLVFPPGTVNRETLDCIIYNIILGIIAPLSSYTLFVTWCVLFSIRHFLCHCNVKYVIITRSTLSSSNLLCVNALYITNKMKHFSCKSGCVIWVVRKSYYYLI